MTSWQPVGYKSSIGLLLLLLFSTTYIHQKQFNSATPVSRLDLLHSLIYKRSFTINAYHDNTSDKAVFRGDYYSDKAPGTVSAALPSFLIASCIARVMHIDPDSATGWLLSSWIACAGSLAIVTSVGGISLYAWLAQHVGARSALIVTIGAVLGSAPLPYSTMLFSHALTVGLLAISLWAIHRQPVLNSCTKQPTQGKHIGISIPRVWGGVGVQGVAQQCIAWINMNRFDLLAGFSSGWAVASEYTSGIAVVGIGIYVAVVNRRRLIPLAVAGVFPLLSIPAYSAICFGTPMVLPYSLQASFPAMQEGIYAIGWPNLAVAFNLMFSPERGLFFWSPFMLLAISGYWLLYPVRRQLFWLVYVVPFLHIIVISGRIWDWPAGPTLGPRLLAPIIPFMALPCAYALTVFPRLGVCLIGYSVAITTVATLTDACPPYQAYPNPLIDLHIGSLMKGALSPNLGTLCGLSPVLSVLVYYSVTIAGVVWLLQTVHRPGGKHCNNLA